MRHVAGLAAALAALILISPVEANPGNTASEAASDVKTEPVATATGTPAAATTEGTNTAAPAASDPPAPPKPVITLEIDIDLAKQRMTVKTGGAVRHSWAVSSGTKEFPTPRGTFKPQWMAKMWHSRKYDDAPMPHSIFFHAGAAIHATNSIGRLGSPASHGCVRLAPANAAALYALVTRHGMASTRISVHGQPKFYEPPVASRREHSPPQRIQMARPAYAPGYAYPPRAHGYGYGQPYGYAAPRAVVYVQPGYGYAGSRPMHVPYGRYPVQIVRY